MPRALSISRYILLLLPLVLIFSCNNNRRGYDTSKNAQRQDTLAPLHITMLANLQADKQPKVTDLDTVPKPRVLVTPTNGMQTFSYRNSSGKQTITSSAKYKRRSHQGFRR